MVDVPVPVSVAWLGGDVDVPTLQGLTAVRIDPGTPPGTLIPIRGGGLPQFQRGGRGRVWVRVRYDVPKKPSRKLKRALEALREVELGEPGPLRRKYKDHVRKHAADHETKS